MKVQRERVGGSPAGRSGLVALFAGLWLASACTPRIVVEAPKEPIVINMNVKIEHEIRIKVDEELEDLFEGNEDLF